MVAWLGVAIPLGTAVADDTRVNDGPAAARDGEEEAAKTYQAIPRSLHSSLQLRFDQAGEVQRREAQMRAQFAVVPEHRSMLLAYRMKNAEVMVSTNEKQRVTNLHPDRWNVIRSPGNHPRSQRLHLHLTTDLPPRSATSLRLVSGDLDLLVGSEPIETIELGSFADITGEERDVPGMEGARFEMHRDPQHTRITMRGEAWSSLVKLVLLDTDGDVVYTLDGRLGMYAARSRYSRSFKFVLPEKGKAILHKWTRVTTLRHRFEARDVPLPASFSDGAVELSDARINAHGDGDSMTMLDQGDR